MKRPAAFRDPALARVLVLAAIAGVGFGLTIPFLTLVARDHGLPLSVIGLMAASYLVTQVFLLLPVGALTDRVGRIAPLAAGFFIEAAASLGFLVADTAARFVLLRVIQGVSLSLLLPSIRALIADITPVDQRGQAYAWLFAGFSGGLLLGPPLGGLIVSALGQSPLFAIAAALDVGMSVWVLATMRDIGRTRQGAGEGERVPYSALLMRPLVGAFILGFGTRIIEGLFIGVWSIYLRGLGASDVEIGLSYSTFALAFLGLSPFSGRFADRGRRWHKLLVANLALGALVISYGTFHWVPVILALGLVEGALSSITIPTLDAYLASVADPRVQGRVQGAFTTIATIGGAVSALGGSLLYDVAHVLPFIAAGGTLMLLAVASVGLIRASELRGSGLGAVAPLVAAPTAD